MLRGREQNDPNENHRMRGPGSLRESGNLVVDHKGAKGDRGFVSRVGADIDFKRVDDDGK